MLVQHVLTITPEEEAEIKKRYGKSEEEIDKDLVILKDWLKKCPHLPKCEEDKILKRILYFNKFSLEKTKQKLDMYYSGQNFVPELFANRNSLHLSMQKVFDYGILVPIPKLTDDLNRISISKLITYDNPNFDAWDYFKCILSTFEIRMCHDRCISDIYIFDLSNTSFNNILNVSPMSVIKLITALQKTYSDRIQCMHAIYAAPYMMTLLELTKKMLSSKMGERLIVHKDLESLYKYVPKSLLPKDYGGSEKPLLELHKQWREFMESEDSWMLNRMKMKSNEKLRIGKSIDPVLFGIDGSFRQLNID